MTLQSLWQGRSGSLSEDRLSSREGNEHVPMWNHDIAMLFPGIVFALIPAALVGWLITLVR